MKFGFTFLILLAQVFSYSQSLSSTQLYQKIENYYLDNPGKVEYAMSIHKNALGYDTSTYNLVYIHWGDFFILANSDSSYIISGGLLKYDGYYYVNANQFQKIKFKSSELPHTMYPKLQYFPTFNINKLEKTFGSVKSYNKIKSDYQVLTSKYLLKVDTLTFRIKSLHQYDVFEGKSQYDEYKFLNLNDSVQSFLLQQAMDLAEASKNFTLTTIKEIDKNRIPVSSFEGKTFAFDNLSSFNNGPLDPTVKGKYVILDFFYQTCYPCHQMTKWILDWIPTIDTSKIVLIGVDPMDKKNSMELFVKDKSIKYPIIIEEQARNIVKYYHIRGYPTLFLLTPDGKIQIVHEGMSKHFLTNAEKIVKR
jgi:hypothetical protein